MSVFCQKIGKIEVERRNGKRNKRSALRLKRAPSNFPSEDRYRNDAAIFGEGICAERMPTGMMVAIVSYHLDSHTG